MPFLPRKVPGDWTGLDRVGGCESRQKKQLKSRPWLGLSSIVFTSDLNKRCCTWLVNMIYLLNKSLGCGNWAYISIHR